MAISEALLKGTEDVNPIFISGLDQHMSKEHCP
jgi:hypothetical protein